MNGQYNSQDIFRTQARDKQTNNAVILKDTEQKEFWTVVLLLRKMSGKDSPVPCCPRLSFFPLLQPNHQKNSAFQVQAMVYQESRPEPGQAGMNDLSNDVRRPQQRVKTLTSMTINLLEYQDPSRASLIICSSSLNNPKLIVLKS